MSDDVPPPPGGYGLDPSGSAPRGPYRSPRAPDPEPPPNFNPPPRNGGRWAVGGVGLALLGVRVLLLCARASSPSYDYSYTPPTLPTSYGNDDPFAALFDAGHASAKPALAVGPMALAAGDHAFYVDSHLQLTDATDPSESLGRALATDLAVTKDRVLWLQMLDGEIDAVPRAGGPKTHVATVAGATVLRADDAFAYVIADDDKNEDDRLVEKIALATGKATRLASVAGVVSALEVDGANVYVAWTVDEGTASVYHVQRIGKSGGSAVDVTTFRGTDGETSAFEHVALGGGYMYYTRNGGIDRVRLTGGTTDHVYTPKDGDFEDLGALAADGEGVYVAHRKNFGAWAVGRVQRPSAKVEELVEALAVQPSSLAAGKTDVYYTTALGVSHMPKHPTSASE